MQQCPSCGATLAAGATWCGQCYASMATVTATAMPAPVGAAPFTPVRHVPATEVQRLVRHTRWGKTPTTFGPTGRLLTTVGVLLPFLLMLVGGLADPFAWGGAGFYGVTIMPWALRDIWKAGLVPLT